MPKTIPKPKPARKASSSTPPAPPREWNGKGVPAQPERRGRRGHPIIEDVPQLGEWLLEQYCQSPRPSIDELRERLRATPFLQQLEDLGHARGLSRTTVAGFLAEWKGHLVEWRAQAARRRVAIESSRAYNDGDDDELFEIDAAIATMTNVKILEELHDAVTNNLSIDEEMQEKLKLSVKMQNARTMRARVRHLINKGVRRVAARIIGRIQPILKTDQEMLGKVQAEIRKAIADEEKS